MGGEEVLLKSVLRSVPIYILSAFVPPKYVFKIVKESLQNSFGTTRSIIEKKIGLLRRRFVYPNKKDTKGLDPHITFHKL